MLARTGRDAPSFDDLLASTASEEFGHVELVAATINTMLTGAADGEPGTSGF
jgi:Mn-containing catalase